ncbi:unnamed protein product [Mycena citricolor]|uniref:DNA-directed RNA polymerase n=1 Tax=Mycena citricolor TaxID=2018698 RepID=A0AAD2HAJ0_9AGAR|nr:unnamed protein product [Mycena citricolor]
MFVARACRRTLRRRGGRTTTPSRTEPRGYAASALAVRRNGLETFLQRPSQYAILPPPLPPSFTSAENDYWYSDSTTQELIAVMDACLYNTYDVPRAKGIFDRLQAQGNPAVQIHMINTMLEAYTKMAVAHKDEADYWVESAWDLFESAAEPTATTFAAIALIRHRFPDHAQRTFSSILTGIIQADIPISDLVTDRVLVDDEEAVDIIRELSKAAIDLNLPHIVAELGEAESLGLDEEEESVPAVRPVVKQTDKTVPFNLETLRKHLSRAASARRALPADVNARQKLLEDTVYDAAKERLAKQNEMFNKLGIQDTTLMQRDLQRWMWQWHLLLKDRLAVEIKEIAMNEAGRRLGHKGKPILSPYLSLVNAERLSMLTIIEVMRLQGTGGVSEGMKTTRALISVGRAVEQEYKAHMCKANHIDLPATDVSRDYFSKMGYRSLQERRVTAAKMMTDNEGWTAAWTQAVRSQVGAILVECLMDVAQITRTKMNKMTNEPISEEQPAFYQSYEYMRGQKLGVIRLNPAVAERISKEPMILHPRHLPMLVKPRPWVDYNQGGYLYSKSNAMRFKDSIEQRSYLKHASEMGHMELVYAGLDVLGSTPWQINKRVFDVVLEVWNSGKRLGKMPPEVYDVPEPEAPENIDTDLAQRNVHGIRMKAYNQAKAANHSDRCSVNYKIEISRSFLHETFYLPHNIDFRGRAYPIPPHLNHIGDDLSRGLLKFADKKPLGERGFRWLKIHLSNLYGFDKANFDDRALFTEQHMDDIYDSALNPLTGRAWWRKADDPWQCLAACFELYSAIESGDPFTYESNLPVHQDGTCNGLQHYAALGGDAQGAQQVNLARGDKPSDVYSHVGGMVEKMLAEDAAKGEHYALLLQGKIARKVVKQTVMTTVYGVTFVGARDQIEKQLRDRKDIPEEECWGASAYLAKKVLSAIGDLFTGAQDIQNWLNLSARLISKSIPGDRIPEALREYKESKVRKNAVKKTLPDHKLRKEQMTSVVWTTPLGLPVCQPYRKAMKKQVMTSMQSVYITDPLAPAEVNTMKQASAFPPNFIHSLDATHMMLTAIECQVQGLTFASVHDSYWTHASDIDTMSSVIRDTFIALHSSDVLQKLRDEFMKRYAGFQIPLLHLRTPGLLKTLRAAGSRIRASPEQAETLGSLGDLVEISDEVESTVEVKKVYEDLDELLEGLDLSGVDLESEDPPESVLAIGDDAEPSLEAEEEETPSPRGRPSKKAPRKVLTEGEKKARRAELKRREIVQLMGKFVNLTDLLPPLPKKGSFEVKLIKDSPYFFS